MMANSSTSYAVLGATGNTGKEVITLLLSRPNTKVNAFCRDPNKLCRLLPQAQDNKRVNVVTGSITDAEAIASAIRGTHAVFLAISTNDNVPGYRVGQDVARTVINALRSIRDADPDETLPRVVLLSSASNAPAFDKEAPWFIRTVIHRAAFHVYADLEVAEQMLKAESSWLTSIFMMPGGLTKDVQHGHRLSLAESNMDWLAYPDLAAAMIEAADDADGKYDGKHVGIVNTKEGGAAFPSGTPAALLRGLLRYYFPWLHAWLPMGGHG